MELFITPRTLPDGRKLLAWQMEGGDETGLWSQLASRNVIAFRVHDGNAFPAIWRFTLLFDGALAIAFSSACTAVDGWQEFGSLNMKLLHAPDDVQDDAHGRRRAICPPMPICGAEKITAAQENVIAECGIALTCSDGSCIIVMSGIAPGSVTIQAPFWQDAFAPEFELASCRRIGIAEQP